MAGAQRPSRARRNRRLRLPHLALPRSPPWRTLSPGQQEDAIAQSRVGSRVRISLEPDLTERPVLLPTELVRALNADRQLRRLFDSMSASMRREIGKWAGEPKSSASRQKRAEKMAERLMHALEGEHDPPPILRALFLRHPGSREAWFALTPNQRRNHLLGIFYYETADARERRAAKAIQAALEAAHRKSGTPRDEEI